MPREKVVVLILQLLVEEQDSDFTKKNMWWLYLRPKKTLHERIEAEFRDSVFI